MSIWSRGFFPAALALFAFAALTAGCFGGDADVPPSSASPIVAEADKLAAELLENPPDGLDRGEIALAFGWVYASGMLDEPSAAKAGRYLEQAIREGRPEAGVMLGSLYLDPKGFGGEPDSVEKALDYYERAAALGDVDANRILGQLYSEGGRGAPRDPEKGRQYYLAAAKRGSDAALRALEPFLGRDGLPATADELIDPELAVRTREEMDKRANAIARVFSLLEERLARFESAIGGAAAGELEEALSAMSPEERARFFEGLDQALEEAEKTVLERRADPMRAGEAALVLGILHHMDILRGANPDQAREYMEFALERGVPEARVTLGQLHIAAGDIDRGMEYLTAAAAADSPDGLRYLGVVYAEGEEGVEPDREKAKEYFRKAARYGDAMSLDHLYRFDKDEEKGADYLAPDRLIDPELMEKTERRSEELEELFKTVEAELEELMEAAVKRMMPGKEDSEQAE